MPEIGYQADTALTTWGSLMGETQESNPDLVWPLSLDVFDRMRREDPQVKSVVRAVTTPILRADWVIDGSGCRPEVVEHIAADLGLPVKGVPYVAPLRTKGRFSWKEHLRLALVGELVYGHSVFEQVYDQSSGLARLQKLAWRPPRTISKFTTARDGGLVSISQRARTGTGGETTIPIDRLVVYVNEREGANWVGESMLRAAYKMWLLKDRTMRVQALTAERNGLGVPVYTAAEMPDSVAEDEGLRDAWLKSEKDAGLKLATSFKAGEGAGASIPPKAKLELLGVTGDLPDTDKPIRYYDEQIARAVLAHFLNLGGDNSKGSYALSDVLGGFFTDSLNSVAQHVADVVNQYVIEDIVDLNWGEQERAPRIVPAPIGEQEAVTAAAIQSLVQCGALTADASLEAFLRARMSLPVLTDTDRETIRQSQAEEAA